MKQILIILIGLFFISNPTHSQLNIQWESRFDNDNKDDFSKAIVIDNAGNSYIVGTSKNGTKFEVVAIKYDPNGVELWNVSVVGPGNGLNEAVGIVLDSNNDPIIGGHYFMGTNDYDIFAKKLSSANGNTVWTYNHPGSANYDELKDMTIDGNDNVILVGGVQLSGANSEFTTLSLSPTGTLNWARSYNPTTNRDFANAVTVDAANNVYVAGESHSGTTQLDFYTIKYSTGGTLQWQLRTDGNVAADRATSIAVAPDGNVYVGGTSYRGLYLDDEIMLVKINPTGVFQWSAVFGGTDGAADRVNSLTVDNDNHVYLAGSLKNVGNGEDFYVARYRPNGVKHWDYLYQSPTNGFDIANEIRISNNFNIYAAGYSNVTGNSDDYFSVKLDTLGVVEWTKRFNGPASQSDQMSDFEIDIDGNLFVTGSSVGTGTLRDFSTIKYCQLETIASENDTICIGASVQLNATGGTNFQWSAVSGDPITASNFTCTACDDPIATPTLTTTYVVSSESASGCVDFDTVVVVVNPLPGPTIAASGPTSFCAGGAVNLTADPAAMYNWSTGENTQTITADTSGTFSLTVTDMMGCQNSTNIIVEVYPIPLVNGGSDRFRCPGDSLMLNATGADTYEWYNIPSYSDTIQNGGYYKPSVSGYVVVFGMSADGCLGKDTVNVTLYPQPLQIEITQGFSGNLFVNTTLGTTSWSYNGSNTGITGTSFFYDTLIYCNGFYEVNNIDENGCKSYDSLTISGETSCLEDTASLMSNEIISLNIYPNPTRNNVNINFENNESRSIAVYSMEGVLVSRINNVEKEVVLDLSDLGSGTYMVTVQGNNSFARARVIKQ